MSKIETLVVAFYATATLLVAFLTVSAVYAVVELNVALGAIFLFQAALVFFIELWVKRWLLTFFETYVEPPPRKSHVPHAPQKCGAFFIYSSKKCVYKYG